jgi:hypothetical protein
LRIPLFVRRSVAVVALRDTRQMPSTSDLFGGARRQRRFHFRMKI